MAGLQDFYGEIERWRATPLDFAAGRHCIAFANAALRAYHGRDVFPLAVCRVTDLKAATRHRNRLLKDKDAVAWLDAKFSRVPTLAACAGDLLLFPESEQSPLLGYSVGVAAGGGYCAAYVPVDGRPVLLVDKALEAAVGAWSV